MADRPESRKADRVQTAVENHYYKALRDFIHEGLAPPPTVVGSGELPSVEAVSQLMTLHEDCVQRVRKKVGGFDARLSELGPDVVVAPLLAELADFYDVSIDDLLEGFALRDDPDGVYDRHAQPRLSTGELDTSVLGPECDAELDRHGWRDRACTVEAYATPYDPRLPLVRSRIALRADGIAWVSYFRPQNFQVALFERLRLIHQQSEQWVLEFDDWRRRRIADRDTGGEWLGFVDAMRELSGQAGLEWKDPSQGRRDLAYDSVIYNVAGWTTEERAALSRSLLEASIPHVWDGSDLRVPNDYEKRVDRIIDAR